MQTLCIGFENPGLANAPTGGSGICGILIGPIARPVLLTGYDISGSLGFLSYSTNYGFGSQPLGSSECLWQGFVTPVGPITVEAPQAAVVPGVPAASIAGEANASDNAFGNPAVFHIFNPNVTGPAMTIFSQIRKATPLISGQPPQSVAFSASRSDLRLICPAGAYFVVTINGGPAGDAEFQGVFAYE